MRREAFRGKVVWITGASSGIGRALALAIAAAGARLILSARRADLLDDVGRACSPAEVHLVPLDLADLDSLPARTAEALACYGSVDIMVHNARKIERMRPKRAPVSRASVRRWRGSIKLESLTQ